MTLSALAYDTTDLTTQLSNLTLTEQWDLAWGPCNVGSNLMYVVRNASANEYMVAIRGTIDRVESIFEDVDSLRVGPLPWLSSAVPMIAAGMALGWQHLSEMVDSEERETLVDFLSPLTPGTKVFVTGHSQGGALASVVASWLHDTFAPRLTIVPYTFAAETAGIGPFAARYDEQFLTGNETEGIRTFNDIDIVPKGFANLHRVEKLYGPEPMYVGCPDEIKITIQVAADTLSDLGLAYVQPGGANPLAGQKVPCVGVDIWTRANIWLEEAAVQHSHFTYLQLLGAPLTEGAPRQWPPSQLPESSSG